MTSLWEPAGGVFWSTPPVASDEGLACWPAIAVFAVATIATLVVRQRIETKRAQAKQDQEKWHLRQHMTAIGGAATLVYLVGIVALTWGRIDTLGSMPLNEVGDFLAGAFGPVAFLWLVLGFLQQGEELSLSTKALNMQAEELQKSTEALKLQAEELKNSVEQQTILAQEALTQREERRLAIEADRIRREKEIKVKFSIRTGSSGSGRKAGEVRNEITVRSEGYHAYNVLLSLDEPFIHCRNIELEDMKQLTEKTKSLNLMGSTHEPRGGNAHLTYEDADGNPGSQSIPFIVTAGRAEFVKP